MTKIEITHTDVIRALPHIHAIADGPSADPTESAQDGRDVSIAMKLCAAARSMKPQYEHAASIIVRAYCDLVDIDHEALDDLITKHAAAHRLRELGQQIDQEEA